jgi:RimJ/RimL family protein N-acetyltransferase
MTICLERLDQANDAVCDFLLRNAEGFEVGEGVPLEDPAKFIAGELANPTGRCYTIVDDQVRGLICMIAQHPREPYPWIGTLLIDAARRRSGLGRAAIGALEQLLADEGLRELRLGVLPDNARAAAFWARLGYVHLDDRVNQNGHLVRVLRKEIGNG